MLSTAFATTRGHAAPHCIITSWRSSPPFGAVGVASPASSQLVQSRKNAAEATAKPPRTPPQEVAENVVSSLAGLVDAWKKDPHGTLLSLQRGSSEWVEELGAIASITGGDFTKVGTGPDPEGLQEAAKILNMVRVFQCRGHLAADIDPLGLPKVLPFMSHARFRETQAFQSHFTFESFGFSEADYHRPVKFQIPSQIGFLGHWSLTPKQRCAEWAGEYCSTLPPELPHNVTFDWTIGRMYERLKEAYSGPIGVEFVHISDTEKCNFLRSLIETPQKFEYSVKMKRKILTRTMKAVTFETYLQQKFPTTKRFGLDGCEATIVGIKCLTKLATLMGAESIVIGMAHRGRINMLHNIMNKPLHQVFAEFAGKFAFGGTFWGNLGDVKYHMGVENKYKDPDTGAEILMSLVPNPSHLESVDPVVMGYTRAKQQLSKDTKRARVIPILIHGDASIAGQGVVYETVQMADLQGYTVGGTIHIVINNQIGFTTNQCDAGSGLYCTDLAKAINAPILHVNADDPEAVTYAMEVALKYRQRFNSDVFIDIIGYRRFGHNELDMPKFTQPKMYELVGNQPSVLKIYVDRLIKEGIVTQQEVDEEQQKLIKSYEEALKKGKTHVPARTSRPYSPEWQQMATPEETCPPRVTGVPIEKLQEIGKIIARIPSRVKAHPTVARVYQQRMDAAEGKDNLDFGFAEALAFGTLLTEGFHVRLAGQDSQRGTFSHRHAAIHDQNTGRKFFPLHELLKTKNIDKCFEIYNSHLSEFAAMGFEYGSSLESPHVLDIWEGQFGDFANGAQVIIDQYLAAGEAKWNHPSSLVLLLPHGYDGQGSEHSSGRIERFLQLCDDREDVIHPEFWKVAARSVIQKHNIQVVNCTNSANFFHVLRRQMHRGFRKPLVVFSPKKLLRLREATSPLEAMAEGTRFLRYIPDPIFADVESHHGSVSERTSRKITNLKDRGTVRRLLLCSGQLYYDLVKARTAANLENEVCISRVEQLSPFPLDALADEIKAIPNLESVVFAQEEPMNQGPWGYCSKRIDAVLRHLDHPNRIKTVIYAGRDVAAPPAVGDPSIHARELKQLLSDALELTRMKNSYIEKYMAPSWNPQAEKKTQAGGAELDSKK